MSRYWRIPRSICLVLGLAGVAVSHAAPPTAPAPIQSRLTPAQMRETGLDTLRPEQLALLNRLLQDSAPAVAAPAAATGDSRPLAPDRTAFAGTQDGPLEAALVGTLEGWKPGTVFALSNGQQWQVLKGEWRMKQPVADAPVVLVPGVMGRWFLQVDENIPMARVQRIR